MIKLRLVGATVFGGVFALTAIAFTVLLFSDVQGAWWLTLLAAVGGTIGGAWAGGSSIHRMTRGESWRRGLGAGLSSTVAGYSAAIGIVFLVIIWGVVVNGASLSPGAELVFFWALFFGAPYYVTVGVVSMFLGRALWSVYGVDPPASYPAAARRHRAPALCPGQTVTPSYLRDHRRAALCG